MRPHPRLVQLLWSVVVLLVLLGTVVVIRRATHLTPSGEPARFPGAASLDNGFFAHPRLTLVHILPGLLFILLGPLQFVPELRRRRPAIHRWAGRVFVASGLVVGISALIMSLQMAIGGANESAATLLFGMLFLFSLMKAFLHIRRRNAVLHREWMIRAFAIGLAVATIRPIVGVFFATSRFTQLTPHDFFGTAFWLGFTLHLIVAEAWIHYTRGSKAHHPRSPVTI